MRIGTSSVKGGWHNGVQCLSSAPTWFGSGHRVVVRLQEPGSGASQVAGRTSVTCISQISVKSWPRRNRERLEDLSRTHRVLRPILEPSCLSAVFRTAKTVTCVYSSNSVVTCDVAPKWEWCPVRYSECEMIPRTVRGCHLTPQRELSGNTTPHRVAKILSVPHKISLPLSK